MSACRLLYLDAHNLTAYHWRRGKLREEGIFEATPAGLSSFAEYLRQHNQGLFHFLSNSGDEGYQAETIPFLHGRDRKTLLARRLTQYFSATPLTATISLGYDHDTRKNERVLLTALTNPALFDPWLNLIDQSGVAMSGIYTVAQLGTSLLAKIGIKYPRCLLFTVQDQSLRESFVVDGHTLFSRITPLTDSSFAGVAVALASEVHKLQQYLLSQRLLTRDEAITALVLAPPLAMTALQPACQGFAGVSFEFIDSHQVAAKLGTAAPINGCCSESLFLHLLAVAPPRVQYADEPQRHNFRISQLRHALWATGLIAIAGALLFAAERGFEAQKLDQESAAFKENEQQQQQRYQKIAATFPPLPIGKEQLRQIVSRHASLEQSSLWPEQILKQVSNVLSDSPAIELEALEWKVTGDNKPGAPAASANETLILSGNVRGGKLSNTRQILAAFDAFVAALEKQAQITVSVLQQPFEIESGKALRSNNERNNERGNEALQQRPFSLQLNRKPKP